MDQKSATGYPMPLDIALSSTWKVWAILCSFFYSITVINVVYMPSFDYLNPCHTDDSSSIRWRAANISVQWDVLEPLFPSVKPDADQHSQAAPVSSHPFQLHRLSWVWSTISQMYRYFINALAYLCSLHCKLTDGTGQQVLISDCYQDSFIWSRI